MEMRRNSLILTKIPINIVTFNLIKFNNNKIVFTCKFFEARPVLMSRVVATMPGRG